MKQITKTIYYCDFCSKSSETASVILNHENRCESNPKFHESEFDGQVYIPARQFLKIFKITPDTLRSWAKRGIVKSVRDDCFDAKFKFMIRVSPEMSKSFNRAYRYHGACFFCKNWDGNSIRKYFHHYFYIDGGSYCPVYSDALGWTHKRDVTRFDYLCDKYDPHTNDSFLCHFKSENK